MKKVFIAGAGKTGESVLRYFMEEGGFRVYVYDDVPSALEELDKRLKGGWVPVTDAKAVLSIRPDIFVPSPGISPRHEVVKSAQNSGAQFLTDIEILEKNFNGEIIGITGTNGKTTVASLTAQMLHEGGLSTFLGGNIGVPALHALEGKYDVAVLELSSFMLHYAEKFSADTGVLVNIDVDHLDWHKSREEYQRDKVEWLFRVKRKRVFNADDPGIRDHLRVQSEKDFPVSLRNSFRQGAWLKGDELMIKNGSLSGSVMFFPGALPEFYLIDVSLACATSFIYRVNVEVIEKVAINFRPKRARFQVVSRLGASHVIDDSKATNPHAVQYALLSVKQKVVLMMGGVNKGLSFKPIRPLLNDKCEGVVFFGRDGRAIMEELKPDVPHACVNTLREAVKVAVKMASESGANILFSPGCASFDEFSGYLERSDKFREYLLEEVNLEGVNEGKG